jgi:hypothetical protein
LRTRLLPACAGLLLGLTVYGCGGDGGSSGPADGPNLDGAWSGPVTWPSGQNATLALSILESNGNISGTGTLTLGGAGLGLSISGSYSAAPDLTVTISSQGFQPITMVATASETQLVGTLDGSGFQNRAITLRRQ